MQLSLASTGEGGGKCEGIENGFFLAIFLYAPICPRHFLLISPLPWDSFQIVKSPQFMPGTHS